MSFAARRAAFQQLVSCYHNSFAGGKAGLFEHSRGFVRRLLREGKDAGLNAAALRLDPRLTSTEPGAVAYSLAKAISEDKALAPHFVDIEMAGQETLVCYFEHQANGVKIERVLQEVGKVGVLAKPGDHLSDKVVSDLWILALEPAKQVAEAVVARLRKAIAEDSVFGGPYDDSSGGDDEQKNMPDHDGVKHDEEPADGNGKGDPDEKDNEGKPDMARESATSPECTALKLDERIFGDAALAACGVTGEQAESLAKHVFGEKAVGMILGASIGVVAEGHDGLRKITSQVATMAKAHEGRSEGGMGGEHNGTHYMHAYYRFKKPEHAAAFAAKASAVPGVHHATHDAGQDHVQVTSNFKESAATADTQIPTVSECTRDRLLRVLGAKGILEGTEARALPEAAEQAVSQAVAEAIAKLGAADGDIAVCMTPELYEAALDDIAVALDGAYEDAGDILSLFVERVTDLDLEPLTEERRTKLVARVREAASKDEAAEKAVILGSLRAVARGIAVESLIAPTPADGEALKAWRTHVTEATKPAPEPADPMADLIDTFITVPA